MHSSWASSRRLVRVRRRLICISPLISSWPPTSARADRLAYWINLYNAATLKLVLAHYPLENIRQIGGDKRSPWDLPVVRIAGADLSLNQIENEIIRPEFGDARIHFALNCAAQGCPPLRAEAFVAARLDAQLDQACRLALNDSRWVTRAANTLTLTKLFEWYADDFRAAAGSVLGFIARYRSDEISEQMDIAYGEYDWALNSAN